MDSVFLDLVLPIYIVGLLPVAFFYVMLTATGFYEDDTSYFIKSARTKIRLTKLFFRDLPLWPICVWFVAFSAIRTFYGVYTEWKGEANEEALRDVSRQLSRLESSLERSKRQHGEAVQQRKRYENLLTKYGK